MSALRFPATSGLSRRLITESRWLTNEGVELSAVLYEVIGALGDHPSKPRLVGLRRAIHQLRQPSPAEWSNGIQSLVPAPVAGRVHRWRGRLARWRQDRSGLPHVMADESREKETMLRGIAADHGFRRALWQSSPSLGAELEKWLADPSQRPRRQSLSRLAKYVSRAAAKTSPQSAFAVSGLASWSTTGDGLTAQEPDLRGVLELSEALWTEVIDALLRRPELWESLTVRANPSVVRGERGIGFLGQVPAEPILTIPATAAVQECLKALPTGATSTLGELRSHLVAVGGVPTATVDTFLVRLVDIGLLELPPPAPGAANAASVAELAAWLSDHGGEVLADVADSLQRLAVELRRPVPVTDPAGYRSQREAIRRNVSALRERFGVRTDSAAEQRVVIHDSVVCVGHVAACATDRWRPVLDDLDRIRRWLAVFDRALPLKLAVGEIWRARFGPDDRVSFLSLHRAVHEEASAPGPQAAELRSLLAGEVYDRPSENSALPLSKELRWWQDRALLPLLRPAPDDHGVVRVDPAVLARQASEWPSWVEPIGSVACYVQPLVSPHRLDVVLNTVHLGHGRARSRLTRLLSLAGSTPGTRETADERTGEPLAGPVLAELGGPNGSAINDRAPSVRYEIDYPYTRSYRPAGQRLPLSDLTVTHDPQCGLLRLHSDRLQAQVRALDLGLLIIPALPPAARLLVQAFGAAPHLHATPAYEDPPPPPLVRHSPRVAAGRVVVRRARWVADADAVPTRHRGESDADYLLRLTEWRWAAGVPDRCFVRAQPAPGDRPVALVADKTRKPVYLDFDNWFLVLSFENMLRTAVRSVVFEEALPDPAQAAEPVGAPRQVELLVEVGEGET